MPAAPDESDVLVVGAGPTGMVLAALLARQGLRVRIVERHPTRLRFPKAHVINPVTLDICARIGFAVPAMYAAALPPDTDRCGRFRINLAGEELGALPFEQPPSCWVARPRINLAQPRFESILEWTLQVQPEIDYVSGRWTGMRRGDGAIESLVSTAAGEIAYRSRFLVAADGAGSSVRDALGIGMTAYGADRPRISVLAGNLRQVLGADPGAIYWVLDPQARGTFVEHGADEWVYIFDSPGPEAESPDYVENRVRRAIGHDDVRFDVLGISPWIMACQVADRFREGDVFLVGDAAHRLPPTGGLGMNTGIQDVENLAWKLAAVVHGWAGDTLLARYEAERRPVGLANALHSQRNAIAVQTLYRTVESALAGAGLESLDDIEVATLLNEQWAHLNSPALQLGYSYAAEGPTASTDRYLPSGAPGRRLPHTWVRHGEQRRAVVDLIDLAGFTVIANGAPEPYRQRAAANPFPVAVVDVAGAVPDEWLRMVGIEATGSAVVVRPDAHVLVTCRSAQAWPLFESRAHSMLSIATIEVKHVYP